MAISAEAENPEEDAFFDWLSTPEGQTIGQYGAEGVSYDMVEREPVLKNGRIMEKLNAGDTDYLINEIGAGFGGTGNYFFEFVLTNRSNSTTLERVVREQLPVDLPLQEVWKSQKVLR